MITVREIIKDKKITSRNQRNIIEKNNRSQSNILERRKIIRAKDNTKEIITIRGLEIIKEMKNKVREKAKEMRIFRGPENTKEKMKIRGPEIIKEMTITIHQKLKEITGLNLKKLLTNLINYPSFSVIMKVGLMKI
jgi:hypothetical protein